MIGELKRLLPGFSVAENTDRIGVWLPGDQEMDVTIKRENGTFLIVASRRSHHFTVCVPNENEAVVGAVFLAKRWYGIAPDLYQNYADSWTARRIRRQLSRSNEQKAIKIISSHLDKAFYIIGSEDASKISMLLHGDSSDVKFHQRFIAEYTSLKNGYLLLYCCGRMMKNIAWEYKNISKIMKCPPSLEMTQELYMRIWELI